MAASRRRRAPARVTCALTVLALGLAVAARAEIFQWTDPAGRTHFTQDLQRVPPEHRREARERAAADAGPSRVQGFESRPAAPAPRGSAPGGPRPGRVHRIPVERAGNGMIVPVRLNGRVVAPFLVDTGASYVLVPQAVAEEAGVQVGPGTRTMQFATANGVVEHAVVMLDSVELGTARAEQVPASISPSLGVGLLGLSFLNRFTVQTDAAAGVLTLVENGLAESGAIRGGRSEAQWRNEFGALRARQDTLAARRAETPASRSRLHAALEEAEAELDQELELLDAEADQANVPDAWRR